MANSPLRPPPPVYRPTTITPPIQKKAAGIQPVISRVSSLSVIAHTAALNSRAVNQPVQAKPNTMMQAGQPAGFRPHAAGAPPVYRPVQSAPAQPVMSRQQVLMSRQQVPGNFSALQMMKRKKPSSDDDEDYVPPQGKKQKRFHIPASVTDQVVRATAHKRRHFNSKKFAAVYTCPACRRPLGYDEIKSGKLRLTQRKYTSKSDKLHVERALQLDHYPPWAERERKLKGAGATDDEIKQDHNDPSQLRALCRVCNGSHKYESKKKVDYTSDTDEEGYFTPDDEPENEGHYKPFRQPPPGSGGAGIST